jgi:hypothetical protein
MEDINKETQEVKDPQDLDGQKGENEKTENTEEQDSTDKNLNNDIVAELRKENAKWRRKLRELEKEKEQKEKTTLEEQQKYKELYEKEAQARQQLEERIEADRQRKALEAIAAKAGFRDTDDIRLVDLSKAEWDGKGFAGLEEQIADLKKRKPYLFKETQETNDNDTGTKDGVSGDLLSNFDTLSKEQREALLKKHLIQF